MNDVLKSSGLGYGWECEHSETGLNASLPSHGTGSYLYTA